MYVCVPVASASSASSGLQDAANIPASTLPTVSIYDKNERTHAHNETKRTTDSSSSNEVVAISPPRITSTRVRVSRSSLNDTTSAGLVEAAHGFVARYDWNRAVVTRDIS